MRSRTNSPGLLSVMVAEPAPLHAAHLTEHDHDLDVGIRLEANEVVDERGAWVLIAADGYALVYTVAVHADNIIQLITHAA